MINSAREKDKLGADDALPDSVELLLSYALALEQEAQTRYEELAELMATHNNKEVAALFGKMSGLEKLHGEEIHTLLQQKGINASAAINYRWQTPEGPETIDPLDLHYLMTAHQALGLALHNEQRAHDFFQRIARDVSDPETRELAGRLAEEEIEHIAWVKEWQSRYPAAESGWDDDDDPASGQD